MSTKWSSSSFSSPCSSVDKSHLKHMCLDFGVFFKKILLPPPPSLSVGQLCRDLGPNSLLELPPGVFDSFFDEYVRQGAFPPPPLVSVFFFPFSQTGINCPKSLLQHHLAHRRLLQKSILQCSDRAALGRVQLLVWAV